MLTCEQLLANTFVLFEWIFNARDKNARANELLMR